MSDALDPATLDQIEGRITAWLLDQLEANPLLAAVDRGELGERRWYVRLRGEDKPVTTIWLTLGQRTLRYETYVLPAPSQRGQELYEYLLRRNHQLVGAQFSVGPEDAIYLVGHLPLGAFDERELDRLVGTVLAAVERHVRTALAIGFGRSL
jgi:hypothetical protein